MALLAKPVLVALEEELRVALAAKVAIRANRKGTRGKIEVPFHNAEEFERLFEAATTRLRNSEYRTLVCPRHPQLSFK